MIPIPTAHGNSDADRNETPRVVVVPSTATPVHETTRHDGTTVTPSSPENTVAGLLTALRFQMEYYFGETNWPHDRYLQSLLRPLPNSRSETWCVPLAALGRFPRVRHYHAQLVVASQSQTMATTPSSLLSWPNTYAQVVDQPANPAWIRRALQHSTVLGVSDNDEWIVLVRNRHGTDRVAVTGTPPDGHEPYTVDSIKPPYGSSASAVNHGTIPAAYPAPAWMPPNLATAMYHPASNLLYYTRHGMHPYAYPPQQGFVAVNYVLPPQRGYSIPASEHLYAAAGAMPTAPFHVDVVPPGAADVPSEPVQSGNTTTESFGDHPVVLREPDPWDYGEFADMAPPPPLSVTSTAATIAPEEDEGFALFPPENLTDPSFVPDGTPSRGIVGYHKAVEEHVYSPESKKPTHKVFRSKGPRQFCNQSGKKQSLPPQEPRTPSEVKRNTTKKGSRGNRKQGRDAKVPSPSPNEMKSIGDGSASGKEQKDPQRGGKGSKTRTRSKQLSKGKMNLLGEHFPALDGNVVSSFPVPTKTPLSASEGISTEGVRRKVAASDTRLEKFATR